jgi:predicted permease
MFSDFRYAARLLVRTPAFAAAAILILAIAIAGNTATFSAVNVLLLEPLPFKDADRLVVVGMRHRSTGARSGVSFPDYQDWMRERSALDRTAAVELEQSFNVSGGPDPVRVSGARMSAALLPLLGVSPIRGRAFLPEDERPGAHSVVLITERFWETRFSRAEDTIGRDITVDGVRATVIGVLPKNFRLLYGGYAVWAPLPAESARMDRARRSLAVVGRLPPGATIDASAASLAAVASRLEREYPSTNAGWRISMLSMREFLLAGRGQTLLFVIAALALLLLVACANVASLQLARAAARQQEIATRLAVGASRWRVVRLLLSEAAVLAALSGVLALALVVAARRILLATNPDLRELAISVPALLFTLVLMMTTTIAFGLVPALTATRVDLAAAVKGTATIRRSTRRLRSALVVAELASSLVLLVPAGLLFKSFLAVRQMQPGFRVDGVLTFSVALPSSRYSDVRRQGLFYQTALSQLSALPGVQSAAASDVLPLDVPEAIDVGLPPVVPALATGVERRHVRSVIRSVGPAYASTFDIPVLSGRSFRDSDTAPAPAVAMVNETLAGTMRPDRAVIGETIDIDGRPATIVGVIGDVRSIGLRTPPQPELLVPWQQRPRPAIVFSLATMGDPADYVSAIRTVIRGLDRDLPIAYLRPMSEVVDEQLVAIRTIALLLAALAALALVLAAAGLSGILSWLVTERTPEMGVRAALGATRRDLVMLVTRDALVLVLSGIVIGLPVAVAVARLVSSQLWGVSALDVSVFVAVPGTLALVGCLASYAPARRAARLEPAAALRAN